MNTANFLSIPASIFPDQEILVYGEHRWTYGQLWQRVQQIGNALLSAGVQPGDRVAVLQTNSDDYVATYFATALIGGVFVPVNYRAKPIELKHILTTARTKVLLAGDRYQPLVEELRAELPTVETYVALESATPGMIHFPELLAGAAPECPEATIDDSQTTILMYTSGTTSLPKGVMLSHNEFTAYVCNSVEMADGTPRGSALLSAPLYHIAGATNIMTSLFTGRKLVVLPQFEPTQWLEAAQSEQVTHAFLVPTMMKMLIDHPRFADYDLSSLVNLSYGGAAMPFPVIRRAIELFPPSVGFVNAFGQTETTSTLTILGPEDHRLTGDEAEVARCLKRLTSIGRPLPDVQVKVVDDAGVELPRGEVGEIWVSTPRVMKGYANEQGGADSPLRDGWLPTRDMGWIDEDGYIFLGGRKDDMIIRGGENIAPAEVEAVLQSHPAVEEAAVIGLPDEEWGQRVGAIVVRRPGQSAGEEEIVDYCRRHLASFKKPEVIHFVDELPKNQMGKVLKTDLRKTFCK
jgi:acyl-CoA synthetase (AMP-forming)/AMP-acid ligase II